MVVKRLQGKVGLDEIEVIVIQIIDTDDNTHDDTEQLIIEITTSLLMMVMI